MSLGRYAKIRDGVVTNILIAHSAVVPRLVQPGETLVPIQDNDGVEIGCTYSGRNFVRPPVPPPPPEEPPPPAPPGVDPARWPVVLASVIAAAVSAAATALATGAI